MKKQYFWPKVKNKVSATEKFIYIRYFHVILDNFN